MAGGGEVCDKLWRMTSGDKLRKFLALLIPLAVLAVLAFLYTTLAPWQRLLATSLGLLYVIKISVLLRLRAEDLRSYSPIGLALYMSLWPGMDPTPLRQRVTVTDETGGRFARGFIFAAVGFSLAVCGALIYPNLNQSVAGFYGLAVLLLMIHFGYADMLTSLMRLSGWDVGPLFEQPFKSTSLTDFWSRRWNLAFVEMDRILFLKPLSRKFGAKAAIFLVFLISGLLHDICISYSAGSGWGLPTIYFLFQGALVSLERRLKIESAWPPLLRRLWTWSCLLLPLPLLFTAPFRGVFILPFWQYTHDLLCCKPLTWYFSLALYCAAAGNFCTMGAGLQVPHRLRWREELAKITPFNRKVFLNYAAYVLLMIDAFGIMTLALHDELMTGGRPVIALLILMGGFWGLRVLVDVFWFKNEDWPPGPEFVIGHTCLTALFVLLTGTYLGLAGWHLSAGRY